MPDLADLFRDRAAEEGVLYATVIAQGPASAQRVQWWAESTFEAYLSDLRTELWPVWRAAFTDAFAAALAEVVR